MCLIFRQAGESDDDSNPKRRKEIPEAGKVSVDASLQFTDYSSLGSIKDISVRVIHAGRREELYQYSVSVAEIMEKYPGMCVARPEVFKNPDKAILRGNEKLLVGHKYYIIPSTTVRKLKLRYQARRNSKVRGEDDKQVRQKGRSLEDSRTDDDLSEESVCSAKDFYVAKERWSKSPSKKKGMRRKPFVPPIQKPRIVQSMAWEPSLTSIQELTP